MARNKKPMIEGLKGFENLKFPFGSTLEFCKSKEDIFNYLVREMQARCLPMFKYFDYPDTFNPWTFEKGLQGQGYCILANVQDTDKEKGWYALLGVGTGGELDASYLPTKAVGANPYLNTTIFEKLDDKSIVWAWNDSSCLGFSDVDSLFAGLLADAYITLRLKLVLHRAPSMVSADSEDEKEETLRYFDDLDKGKLGVIARKATLQRLTGMDLGLTHPLETSHQNSLKEIIETIQYLSAQWFIKKGLNDNYNMKRESLNSTETEANQDTLIPFIEDMLNQRKRAIEEWNKKSGFNIHVELAGAWKKLVERQKRLEEKEKAEIEAVKQQAQSLVEQSQEQPKETKEDE